MHNISIYIYIAIQYYMYVCIIAYLRQYIKTKTPCQNWNLTMIKTCFSPVMAGVMACNEGWYNGITHCRGYRLMQCVGFWSAGSSHVLKGRISIGGWPTPPKNMTVRLDHHPNYWGKMFQTTNQSLVHSSNPIRLPGICPNKRFDALVQDQSKPYPNLWRLIITYYHHRYN